MMRTLISIFIICTSMRGGDVVVVVGQPSAGVPTALNTSLISYWKMDEASGSAVDSEPTGTPQDMTETGTISSIAGIVTNAREAASAEYFSRTDEADISTGNIDFTIAAWVNLNAVAHVSARYLVGKWGGSAATQEFLLFYDSATPRFYFAVGDGSTFSQAASTTFGAPSVNTWYLIVAWHDSVNNQIGISVNAGAADVVSWTTGAVDSGTGLAVGALSAAGTTGTSTLRVDEVGFWKKVLTSGERTELYNAGAGITCCPFP
jgi:hypothetical protein